MDLEIRDEFIKLGQALKLAGIAASGIEAKMLIEDGVVLVNGETETGKFLHSQSIGVRHFYDHKVIGTF